MWACFVIVAVESLKLTIFNKIIGNNCIENLFCTLNQTRALHYHVQIETCYNIKEEYMNRELDKM